ncbi:MAG: hypothetical protein QNJ55_10940 [Xenococcus sp. MO_188.B8]|nr:hypothetical protein [Xenococcus sp. MO_188.B8]
MSPNPFQIKPVSPEFLVGRQSEIDLMFDQIVNKAHLAIYGGSGIGKSSLLKYASSPQAWINKGLDYSQVIIVELNCRGINPFTPSDFWREVVTSIKNKIEPHTELGNKTEQILKQEIIKINDIRPVLREIGMQEKFLLLLLDDFDVAVQENPSYSKSDITGFLYEFRTLAVHRQESIYLSSVITSFDSLDELDLQLRAEGSHWYNHYLFKLLKPFSRQEARELFFTESSQLYIPINPELRPAILEITDGHPALLQNAGFLLYSVLSDGEIIDKDQFIDTFYAQTRHIFRGMWRTCSSIEQVLLMLIALNSVGGHLDARKYVIRDLDRTFSQQQRELIKLEERGIIRSQADEDKTIYCFASSMMEWWAIQELQNTDLEPIKEREKLFKGLIGRRGYGQIKKIVTMIQQNPAVAKKVFQIIRKIFIGL